MPIWGTSPEAIDLAEDRERFGALLASWASRSRKTAPPARWDEARAVADRIGYPVMVRPSYVLGGRAMAIVYDETELDAVHGRGGAASRRSTRC